MVEEIAAANANALVRGSASHRRPIPWGYAALMLSGAERRGADTGLILRRVGLAMGNPPSFLSEDEFTRLLRRITRVTRDELWGLASEPIPFGTFEAVCRSAARAGTLEDALKASSRTLRLALKEVVVRTYRDDATAFITIVSRHSCPPTLESALIFLIYGFVCWLAGIPLPLERVELRDGPSPRNASLTRYYRAPLEYNLPRTRLLFSTEILGRPVVINGQRLETFIRSAPLGLIVRYRDPLSLSERLRGLLQRNLAGMLDLSAAAEALSVSPQTLRRKLAAEGTTYRELKDEIRRDLAIEFLADRRKSMDDIALKLGFAEHSSFHRAFRRWTGMSPGVFRPSSSTQS